jgi:beta-phosphoglucomutase
MVGKAGFIFDMDGTLLDNTRFHTQSWLELLTSLGIQMSAEDLHRHAAGKTTREVLWGIFGPQLLETQILEYSERKEQIYRALCRPHLKPWKV